jgi:hypothetical protein
MKAGGVSGERRGDYIVPVLVPMGKDRNKASRGVPPLTYGKGLLSSMF